ncbi:MAG: outer membrane beta-barrel protein [Dysgonomonas sp.]|nr:outer membrane beta-barrel protein [Dysgonomonas sp.]
MKKLVLAVVMAVISMGAFAQTGSKAIMPKIGYQTEYKRVLFGVEGRYFLTNNIRLAPSASVLFPKDHTTGLDIDVNVHYVFPMEGGFAFYPLAGGAMLNNRWSNSGQSTSWTDFGFNVGGGLQYDVMDNGYLNFEFKYTFVEGKDPAYFMLGYGVRF